MSTALQFQFFMVQSDKYSVIVKIKCKIHNITNRKRLPWCEFSGASKSWPASRKLQSLLSVSSRTKFWTSRSRRRVSGLVSVSAQKVSYTSLSDITSTLSEIRAAACRELKDKKAKLSLRKTRYSLYSSCCSTDFQGRPRSVIFILSKQAYSVYNIILVINSNSYALVRAV